MHVISPYACVPLQLGKASLLKPGFHMFLVRDRNWAEASGQASLPWRALIDPHAQQFKSRTQFSDTWKAFLHSASASLFFAPMATMW